MNTWLKRILIGLGVLFLLVIILVVFVQLAWDRPVRRVAPQMAAPADTQTIARGEYLYKYTLICWGCHGSEGSKSPDEAQAGGLEFDLREIGPPGGFGVVYAANVTPDRETGIGEWTDGEIVRAIREGLDPEGHILFPIMEAEWWNGLSDEDTLALVAYMRSLEPVHNEVQENRLSFVAKMLSGLRIVNAQPAPSTPVEAPPKGVNVEYGEYLATRASSCVGCHTPRDPNTGQFDLSRPFAGGLFPIPEEGYNTTGSNLTPDVATGMGDWTEEQFITAMQTGLRPDGTVMFPFMPWPSYRFWQKDDLRAVWLYLRSLEPIVHEVPGSTLVGEAASGTGSVRGEALFAVYCAVCHGEKGIDGPFATGSIRSALRQMDDQKVFRIIQDGPETSAFMPGYFGTLSEEQINDLIDYLRSQ